MTVPVIAGAAALAQHTDENHEGLDAIELMVAACRKAAPSSLLERAGLMVVPQGTWRYPDPGRLVAESVGAWDAKTVRAEIGVLQTTILSTAVESVAKGEHEVAIVVGGEALDRRRVARRHGRRATETVQDEAVQPDAVLRPTAEFRGAHEAEWDIEEPFIQYALLDSARRARLGIGVRENRHQIASRWHGFSRVAADNPSAWDRRVWTETELLDLSVRGNRMLAAPYSGLLVTRMHVDQAAALVICSPDAAERAGIPRSAWVHPRITVDCALSVPMVERAEPGLCRQWELVARELEAELGAPIGTAVDLIDLYSCFPIAVAHQVDAFRLNERTPLSVTGGMTFGGGPLNNAALQAMARSVEMLRQPGSHNTALVTAVSGLLTKQGAVLFQRETPESSYAHVDLTDTAKTAVGRRAVVGCHSGAGIVDAVTVVVPKDGNPEVVAVVRTHDGKGTIGRTSDPAAVHSALEEEWVGRPVELRDGALATSIADAVAREKV